MGHLTSKNYLRLQSRLDRAPQGAPKSDTLFKILEHLFTEKEAGLVSKLPINYFTLEKAAKIWKMSEEEAEGHLNGLADKGLLVDFSKGDKKVYAVSPTMAGFFEWSIMKIGEKFNKQLLSELYYQYLNVEDEFGKRVFALNPPIDRVFVHEDTIQKKDEDIVMSYERATEVVEKSDYWAVGICYCRHKMEHLGKSCGHSMDVCLAFNDVARSMVKHKIYREISKEECMKIVKDSRDEGLVQIGSNMQDSVSWMCNCCGCCCEALIAYRKLGYNSRIHTNWLAVNDEPKCTGCSVCVQKCPVDAMKIVENEGKKYAVIDPDRCIGCGVCTRFCPTKSLTLERRKETNFVPKDSLERHVLEAIDSCTLQNLIFDNHHLWGYGILRAVLKIIFKLPPAKWLMANRQLQSRFVQALGNSFYKKDPSKYDHKKPDYSHPELKQEYGKYIDKK
ncbi:MAG: 4Fe-4S dicluster-binding protein [Nanoarchaeota archaeon]|nr:4Fe-4S dicluster-binding protein [Nanoarchaeota archaeon]